MNMRSVKNNTSGAERHCGGSKLGKLMLIGALICFLTFAAYTARRENISELEQAEIKAANAISQNDILSAMLPLDQSTASVFAESDIYEGAGEQDWSVWDYLEEIMRRLLVR